jgi:hypothetical protein
MELYGILCLPKFSHTSLLNLGSHYFMAQFMISIDAFEYIFSKFEFTPLKMFETCKMMTEKKKQMLDIQL